MPDLARTSRPPLAVAIAAALLVVLGLAGLVTAVMFQRMLGNPQIVSLLPPLGYAAATFVIAWGLMRRGRWAWWLAVLLASLLIAAGLVALIGIAASARAFGGPMPYLVGYMAVLVALLVIPLGGVVVLLLLPQSRGAFRRPPA